MHTLILGGASIHNVPVGKKNLCLTTGSKKQKISFRMNPSDASRIILENSATQEDGGHKPRIYI